MSDEPFRCPACKKVCYTKPKALQAAAALRRKNGAFRHPVHVYRCPRFTKLPASAGHFHVGHQPWAKNRRRKKGKR